MVEPVVASVLGVAAGGVKCTRLASGNLPVLCTVWDLSCCHLSSVPYVEDKIFVLNNIIYFWCISVMEF